MSSEIHPPFTVTGLPIPEGVSPLGEIFEGAILENGRSAVPRLRRYGAYAIVLVLDIRGVARYGDETGFSTDLAVGDIILVEPELGHTYGPEPGSVWSEAYLSFRGPVFDCMKSAGALTRPSVRRPVPVARWKKRMMNILSDPLSDRSQNSGVGRLVSFLADTFATPETESGSLWIAAAKRLLDTDRLTVAETTARLSATTGLSPETLRKRFRAETGVPMKSWQIAGKVDTARSLLARGGMSQKEIAAALGFSHPQHFSRTLKKITGRTPGDWSRDTARTE